MASYFTLLLCISLAVVTVSGLKCLPCELVFCRDVDPSECQYGAVHSPCRCCLECGKGAGEECGGPRDIFGTCAKGLMCCGGHYKEKPGYCNAHCPIGR